MDLPSETVLKNKKISIFEGSFYALMVSWGESLIIPFALSLSIKPSQIGILATLPVALGGLSQFFMPWLEFKIGHRKILVFFGMFLQVFGLFYLVFFKELNFLNLLCGSTLYWIGGAGVQPLWASWMIPKESSQSITLFHARRNALIAFITFVAFLSAGYFLYQNPQYSFFKIFFLGAAISRSIGAILILFHIDYPHLTKMKEISVSFHKIKPRLKLHMVWPLIGILVFFRMGAGLASPHFAQYMLQDLNLNYLVFTFLIGSGFLGRTIFLESWMVTSHEFGLKNTLIISCATISVIPALWILSDHTAWLFLLEVLAGGSWAAFELLTIFILAGLGLTGWARFFGLLNMLVTFGALGSGWFGGKLLEWGFSMEYVFLLSSLLRGLGTGMLALIFVIYVRKEISFRRTIPIFISSLSLRPSFSNINWFFWRRISKDME